MDLTSLLYEQRGDLILMRAMPLLVGALCVLAIAYRYYSAFLAARVMALDDANITPAHTLNDGQNYHPTNKWVLWGHHFAAISGAGPLIGPVLAIQFGYLPGLLWLVIGVCLAGAVQDMLVLAASVRRGGKSLAEIARTELGTWATAVVSAAILFVVIIALAGLGIVVVKALGGEEVALGKDTQIKLPAGHSYHIKEQTEQHIYYQFPEKCEIKYPKLQRWSLRPEGFVLRTSVGQPLPALTQPGSPIIQPGSPVIQPGGVGTQPGAAANIVTIPAGVVQVIPGSSWGTFTIFCTIPIALFVGLYMYRIRKGRVVEASLLGAVGVIAATIIGAWIPGSPLEPYFSLTREQTIMGLCAYGFIASVLPVWMLLCPRDYLSSFLKVGTIILLIVGVIVANPVLRADPLTPEFSKGGPTFEGNLFPFVFICIMCGAVSGFHSLVSSGTTPKMIDKETHVRPIGYGAMLMEGVVGIVALVAAASLHPTRQYYPINVDDRAAQDYGKQLDALEKRLAALDEARDPLHQVGVRDPHQLRASDSDLARLEQLTGGESLRGRTGGAVTLAVGMALIFTDALAWTGWAVESVMKYWYHFAIMFEALFILTTIDTGTRIARFLLQEALGKLYKPFEKTDWPPGAILSTFLVTAGWGALIWTGSIGTIWPMFGIANQLLAVIALCLVTVLLVNGGKAKYAWVTLLPMLFVISTTMTAGWILVTQRFPDMISKGGMQALSGVLSTIFTVFVIACVATLLLLSAARWAALGLRPQPTR